MSGKVVGTVVARALAIFFLTTCVYWIVMGLMLVLVREYRATWQMTMPYVANGAIQFLAAAFLWRNAGKFSGNDAETETGETITADRALRIAIMGIAVYFLFAHFSEIVNLILDKVTEAPSIAEKMLASRQYSVGGIATFVVALVTLIVTAKGATIGRFFSYTNGEQDDLDLAENPPSSQGGN